ncbi:acyl-CoA N-acyltransferase, partial [Lasiosphaeria miniovina]
TLPTPILTLPKSIIRPIHASDAAALVATANSPRLARGLRAHFPSPYTLRDAEAWIARCAVESPRRSFAVCDPATNAVCGGVSLRVLGGDEARTFEIGYYLGEAYWGGGVMSEAVAAFARWAFAAVPEAELQRLEAGVYSFNPASARVLAKAGFVFEGCRRGAGFKHGEAFDILMYGLLRQDLE